MCEAARAYRNPQFINARGGASAQRTPLIRERKLAGLSLWFGLSSAAVALHLFLLSWRSRRLSIDLRFAAALLLLADTIFFAHLSLQIELMRLCWCKVGAALTAIQPFSAAWHLHGGRRLKTKASKRGQNQGGCVWRKNRPR
jgi:hypothetical protein